MVRCAALLLGACFFVAGVGAIDTQRAVKRRSGNRLRVHGREEPEQEVINPINPNQNPEDIPGCAGVECGTPQDGGVFAAKLAIAREHAEKFYENAPIVITKQFCQEVLEGLRMKLAPYWNPERMMCNEEREHVLAQCEKQDPGYLDAVQKLCPNAAPPKPKDDFKMVTYVKDLPANAKEPKDPRVMDLKYTKDGKPVQGWDAFPLPPSAQVDAHKVRGQQAIVEDCIKKGIGCPIPAADAPETPVPAVPSDGAVVALGESQAQADRQTEESAEKAEASKNKAIVDKAAVDIKKQLSDRGHTIIEKTEVPGKPQAGGEAGAAAGGEAGAAGGEAAAPAEGAAAATAAKERQADN